MSDKRPGLGEIRVGDRLTACLNSGGRLADRVVVVTRIGRTYAYAQAPEYITRGYTGGEYKFNRVTGYIHGGNYSSPGRILTAEQVAWDEREKAAEEYLTGEHIKGVWVLRPRWHEDLVTLANLLRAHDGLEPL